MSKKDMEVRLRHEAEEMAQKIRGEVGAPLSGCASPREYMVRMRDGVGLHTQVFLPEGDGSWPVILIRYPYPTMVYMLNEISKIFAERGYAVVSQQCRGTAGSEGEWTPFVNERNDGLDTLDWIVDRKWQNGSIGLFGHSYLSFTQWAVADCLPPQVKTMILSGFGSERYSQMYMNGMFRHEIYTAWAIGNSGVNREEDEGALYQKALRMRPHIDMDEKLLGSQLPWYREWITQDSVDDRMWSEGLWPMLQGIPGKINVPVLMTAGWFDHQLDSMLTGYENFREDIKSKSRLIVGPWTHALQSVGDLEYPGSQTIGIMGVQAALVWFGRMLKGEPMPMESAVSTYVTGRKEWKSWGAWPPDCLWKKFYLGGPKDMSKCGILSENKQGGDSPVQFVYDPCDPVETIGGAALLAWMQPGYGGKAPGSQLQPEAGCRDDIISFVSEKLSEDMLIAGKIKVFLNVSSSTDDTAFSVKVMEVFENGKAYNIRDGIMRLAFRGGDGKPREYAPGTRADLCIELWPIAWQVSRGSRIRLDVSSSNFPAYHAHSNISGPWAQQDGTREAEQAVYPDKSYMEIPVYGENGD